MTGRRVDAAVSVVLLAVVAPPKRAGERGVMVNPVATRLCCTEVSTTTSAMVKNSFVDMTMRDVIVRRRVSSQFYGARKSEVVVVGLCCLLSR